jgi:hypothetical protein
MFIVNTLAYFYSVRGWLEVEPDNFASAIAVVKSLQSSYPKNTKIGLYLQDWCWQETPVNWTRYLFEGADVTFIHSKRVKTKSTRLNKL